MAAFPGVAFAVVSSEFDLVQVAYYNTLALSFSVASYIDEQDFLRLLTQSLFEHNQSPNFVVYVLEGH